MPGLRIGTCSWKYSSWEGLVYSRSSGINFLSEYARRYSTVEIDQWFWTLPDPATVGQYSSSVPEDFRFTVKAPNQLALTHLRGKSAAGKPNPDFLSPGIAGEFLARLSPLQRKTGALMLQFEYLNKTKMGSQKELLSRLETFFSAPEVAGSRSDWTWMLEPRNPQWLDSTYFQFLVDHGLGHVFIQGYYMPPVTALYEKFGRMVQGTSVVRLHGPDREGIEKLTGERWDSIVAPKDNELPAIAGMMDDMLDRGLVVYLNVNNHYEGSAPLTIEKLRALLGSRDIQP
jgi:uncharacterized protein YecE (DUF72 family)